MTTHTYDPDQDHDPLPGLAAVRCTTTKPAAPAASKSVSFAACPSHALGTGRLTGLVSQGEHLAWRHHTKQLGNGDQVECSASGMPVCELPGRVTVQPHAATKCRCQK